MGVKLNPYLSFDGDAREALAFYQSVFGGSLELSTFADLQMNQTPEDADKIMHGMLQTENGLTLMGADTPQGMELTPNGAISLSGPAEDGDALRGYWEKLSTGGTVVFPLGPAPWGDSFGSCRDKFGVEWMVNIAGAGA